ncbi:MAG: hypothetical protein V3T30_04630, partial [Thermodesulfobacteriota bacterium]
EGSVEVEARIPIIPGITTSGENIRAIVKRVFDMGAQSITPLPYNPLGFLMRETTGREPSGLPASLMTREEEEDIRLIFTEVIGDLTGDPETEIINRH